MCATLIGAAAKVRAQQAAAGYESDDAVSSPEHNELQLTYVSARSRYRLRVDGQQCERAKLEMETIYAWVTGVHELESPPTFLAETHIMAERAHRIDIHH